MADRFRGCVRPSYTTDSVKDVFTPEEEDAGIAVGTLIAYLNKKGLLDDNDLRALLKAMPFTGVEWNDP